MPHIIALQSDRDFVGLRCPVQLLLALAAIHGSGVRSKATGLGLHLADR